MINGNRQARADLEGLREMNAPVCELGKDGDEK